MRRLPRPGQVPVGGLLLAALLAGCGSPSQPTDQEQDAFAAKMAAINVVPVPYPANLDVSTWQPVDLSTVTPAVPLLLNLPVGATLNQELPQGGYYRAVEIDLNDEVMLMVYSLGASSLREAIATEEGVLYGGKYSDVRKIVQEPNGFVYTLRARPAPDGTIYPAQSHFVYFIKGYQGAYYEVTDSNNILSMQRNIPAHFPEAQARRLYAAVKQSLRLKPPRPALPCEDK